MNPFKKSFASFVFWAFLFRLLFSIFIPLIDDEAYHWSWTKNIAWSYFDHPGMIAWLEKISVSLIGQNYLGVRLPSYICFALCTWVVYKLTLDLFDKKSAELSTFLMLTIPFYGFGGLVAAPETPYILFWMLGAYIFWQRVRLDEKRWDACKAWLLVGVVTALGINSKLITVLLVGGIGLFTLFDKELRKDLKTAWPWLGFLIFICGVLPIVLWNQKYDWPSFRFQFQERHSDQSLSVSRWLGFFGAQVAFLTPFLYFLTLATFGKSLYTLKESRWKFLFFLSLPSFLVFYPQPLRADYKPHWSGTAYLVLLMGACFLYYAGLKIKNKTLFKSESSWLKHGFLWIAIPLNFILYVPVVYPIMPKAYKIFAEDAKKWNPKWDMSNEFYGWEFLGEVALKKQQELQAQGKSVFLSANRYETTAQFTWATRSGPEQKVYMLSKTRSEYTITQKNEIENLVGKDTLFVVSDKYPIDPQRFAQFDSCSQQTVPYYRQDELAREFSLYHCLNFQKILR